MALTGIELASSILITTVSPVDVKYGPFEGAGITAAKLNATTQITSNFRYKGLTVGLVDTTGGGTAVIEYWFEGGILDANLVLKSTGTTVVANPGTTTSTLTSITIGSVNYAVSSGGIGGSGTVGKIPKWGSTTTSLTDSVIVEDNNNIGIGTSSPSTKLEVNGRMKITGANNFLITTRTSASQANYIQFYDTTTAVNEAYIGFTTNDKDLKFQNLASTGTLTFGSGGSTAISVDASQKVGIGITTPTKKLEVKGDFSARNIESIGNNTGVTFPAVLGWYRIMEWGGASRGGTVVKLSTTGGNVAPTTYVINAFKTYGDPASTNTLKLEQYGNSSYLTKARIATDSVTNITHLEVYLNALGSGGAVVPMMVFHDSLLGYDNNTIVYSGTVSLAPLTSDVQEELPFVHEGTSVEKLYADNVNLLNLQVNSAQGSNGDVLTSTGSGVGWTQPQTGTNVVANPGNPAVALETITIGSTNYGVGTVLGSGTQNRVTKWSVGGSGIEDSEITDTGSNITLGESQPLYGNALQLETVSGEAILPAYGRGVINGYPAGSSKLNLKMSTGFNNAGAIVDSYIYDTFEVTIAALEALGDTPLTGQVLVDTPSDLTCLLADFWFYRKIDGSDIGNWGDDTELVIYPSNDLSGQTIASPYEQGYFRVTHDFLSTAAVGGKSSASSGLYQGNINGIDQGGMNGAWQIGDNSPPLGNKVYLSLSTGKPAPTFASGSQTRFFIGLKYRFLSFQYGVENNQDLITIDVAGPVDVEIYQKCDEATGENNCDQMPLQIKLPLGVGGSNFIIIQKDATGQNCCYFKQDTGVLVPDPGFSVIGTFVDCDELPIDCTK
jgi:hypothetical protein